MLGEASRFRNRQHATKGINVNTGDPFGARVDVTEIGLVQDFEDSNLLRSERRYSPITWSDDSAACACRRLPGTRSFDPMVHADVTA